MKKLGIYLNTIYFIIQSELNLCLFTFAYKMSQFQNEVHQILVILYAAKDFDNTCLKTLRFYRQSICHRGTNILQKVENRRFLKFITYFSNTWLKSIISDPFCVFWQILRRISEKC